MFTLSTWSEIAFWDDNGKMHVLKLGLFGLFLFTILKIVSNFICIRWGKDAVETFKPIVKDIDREELLGTVPNHGSSETYAEKIKVH